MMNWKKYIPVELKYNLIYLSSPAVDTGFAALRGKPKVIIALAADYGNLGDVAISYAQAEFLNKRYPGHQIVELPISQTFSKLRALQEVCCSEDIITIAGGGNMGDRYEEIEYCRKFVIKQFPNNPIISFPQTIDFSHTKHGCKKLQETIKAYSVHRRLTLIAREVISQQLMKAYFPSHKVLLMPDVVMTLDKSKPQCERRGILLCLRSDQEQQMNPLQAEQLAKLHEAFGSVRSYDTHIRKAHMLPEARMHELNKIWNAFKSAQVVITDRLHGMIFCYITKTPCLVFPSLNYKIKASFEWIKDCGYIQFCEEFDMDTVLQQLQRLSSIEARGMKQCNLERYFDCI